MRAPKPILMLAAALGTCALIASGGCLFSPDTPETKDPVKPAITTIFPSAPDSLMANFKTAYTSMQIDIYRDVLHPDYRFLFSADDVNRLGLPSSFETYADDITTTQRMFSGASFQKPDGTPVPGVSSIRFDQLERTTSWVQEPPDNPDFPNAERAMFHVEMSIIRVGEASILVVKGDQEFFVSYRDSTYKGIPTRYYQLRGQRDFTSLAQ